MRACCEGVYQYSVKSIRWDLLLATWTLESHTGKDHGEKKACTKNLWDWSGHKPKYLAPEVDPEDKVQNGDECQIVNITSFCPGVQGLQHLYDSSISFMGPILAMNQDIKEVSVWALKAGMRRQRGTDMHELDP